MALLLPKIGLPQKVYLRLIHLSLSLFGGKQMKLHMAMAYRYYQTQIFCGSPIGPNIISYSTVNQIKRPKSTQIQSKKRCLRCNTLYSDHDNSPAACSFHGHMTGEKGLFSLAPPHQGIDGEWSDRSGVIVYKWNEKNDRPNTGSVNWKKRWSCCSEFDEEAPPCRRGWHVSYDDGFTLY